MESTQHSPKVSIIKSDEGVEESLHSLGDSALSEPPIPPGTTYHSPPTSPTKNSPSWDYEDYIEKPRGTATITITTSLRAERMLLGHVAEPHYIHPEVKGATETREDYTARSFMMEEPQGHAESHVTSLGISAVVLSLCAYLFGFLGGLVVVLLERKNLFAVFHGFQSMVVGALAFTVQMLVVWQSKLFTFLWLLYLGLNVFLLVRVVLDAPSQRLFKLPLVGSWCEHRAYNRIQHASQGNGFRYNRVFP